MHFELPPTQPPPHPPSNVKSFYERDSSENLGKLFDGGGGKN